VDSPKALRVASMLRWMYVDSLSRMFGLTLNVCAASG